MIGVLMPQKHQFEPSLGALDDAGVLVGRVLQMHSSTSNN